MGEGGKGLLFRKKNANLAPLATVESLSKKCSHGWSGILMENIFFQYIYAFLFYEPIACFLSLEIVFAKGFF